MTTGTLRRNLTWAGTVAVGAWLSMSLARRMADRHTSPENEQRDSEPVREIVEEVLDEHRTDDTPIVHAFEMALETSGSGTGAQEGGE